MKDIIKIMREGKGIDRDNPLPIYIQLREIIREIICENIYESIPKEIQIGEIYKVSRDSVAKAISGLVKEGLLFRIKRKGTFVNNSSFSADSKSNLIGVIWPISAFWDSTISSMCAFAEQNGYKVRVCSYDWSDLNEELRLIEEFKKNAKGIILYPNSLSNDVGFIRKLSESAFPCVLVDLHFPEFDITNRVSTDNFKGTFEATEHLIKQGYQNIVYLKTENKLSSDLERFNGFIAALKKHAKKILPSSQFLLDSLMSEDEKMNTLAHFCQQYQPDAMFCTKPSLSQLCFRVCKKLNLRIPEDVGVIVFDDFPEFSFFDPPLTVIKQDFSKIGEESVRVLLDSIENRPQQIQKILLPTKLIIRKSTMRA